jgi:hypothetical protein
MKLFDIQQTPGSDECAVDAENAYNRDVFSYRVNNYRGAGRDALVEFASPHTNLRFSDGAGAPKGGIDVESQIRNGAEWHARGRRQLQARVYHAVPDMSRGKIQDDTQKIGDVTHDRMTALSGVTVDRFEPVGDAHRDAQNADHIVPSWTRSGDDTRQATRTLAYVSAQGFRRETPASPWVLER